MNMKDFSETNATRCRRWHPINSWSLSDWMTALVGEIGEAANLIKKMNRLRDGIRGRADEKNMELLRHKLIDELADAYTYLDLLFTAAGIDREKAVKEKFNKTSVEYNFPERL
jgi:NTP pyrophosphatase (non-canonical NTP hydrolase)